MVMLAPDRYRGGDVDRRTAREVTRLDRRTHVEVERVRQAASIEAAKVEAVGYVGTVALMETAHLGVVEAALAHHAPHNARRLQYVADRYTEAIADRAVRLSRSLS
ncbi:hypothetical protein LRS13_13835 [Svornostia abyssi]|uniref:Uncharacterized protein n=1 Tax=Svornostia abyssi TaxID=2898438 RepID=A0ABY5PBH7_9ACTN|nr:hypothetical protein LRS13_13835 [Parviterribacteraceae bacterium J379]